MQYRQSRDRERPVDSERQSIRFSEAYAEFRSRRTAVREEAPAAVSEHVLQCVWYDQLFSETNLCTDAGRPLHILSPGWWNHGEGPDFKGAQIEFNGELRTGDVEIHLNHGGWTQHGHHLDARYNDVLLMVVLETEPPSHSPLTAAGRPIPSLLLGRFLEEDIRRIADRLLVEDYPYRVPSALGQCSELVHLQGAHTITNLLNLAGEWRMLNKARLIRERMEKAGVEQGIYESFLAACGYAHFKHHFQAIARQFHYERVRQLGRQDPLLLEAAFLQIAGLLPETLPTGTNAVPHFARLRGLRRDRLSGLRSLPLVWRRVGVRPNNNPERRLAGAARFLARTAAEGLLDALETVWRADLAPTKRRQAFEDLFPSATGFWATHYTWAGKAMKNPAALLGSGRVRCIIGNVFVPAALALARQRKDRIREETVLEFFAALPKEPENQVVKTMIPRVLGPDLDLRLNFRMQQGMLQLHQDWCSANPSCHNCSVIQFLAPSNPAYGPG